jgi:molybdopterin synthase catalytic subunit
VKVTVRLFAYLRDAVGVASAEFELPESATVEDVARALAERFPALAGRFESLPCLVEGRPAGQGPLSEGAEVAWIPPVAGGARLPPRAVARAEFTSKPLDLGALVGAVSHPGAGAVATFLGIVRDQEGERPVEALEYEAYARVAEEALAALVADCAARWPAARLAVAHRVGRLAVGEASVAIAASAPHREEAFAACRFLIEGIKRRIPIWKKSYGPDGAWWVEGEAFEAGRAPE